MTKIQPFGCDVTAVSRKQKNEFLSLLNKYEKYETFWDGNFYCYFGIKEDGKTDAFFVKQFAKDAFTRLVPISEGIAILKQALGEEEQPKENDGWISVKDRLPKIGKDYLVTDGQACMVSAFRVEKQAWDFWSLTFWSSDHVTHWMPLPKRPNS